MNIYKYEFRKIDWEKDRFLKNTLIIGLVDEIPKNLQSGFFKSPSEEVLYVSSIL